MVALGNGQERLKKKNSTDVFPVSDVTPKPGIESTITDPKYPVETYY
jgi:hypothetical protein